jgi:nucleoside-diphosphate-sugar epimerase
LKVGYDDRDAWTALGFVPEYPFKEALKDYVEDMKRDPV